MARTTAKLNSTRGFTLLELTLVLGIVGMMMGLGIGMLGGGDGRGEALLTLRSSMRQAATAARARSAPTEVVFEPAADGAPASLQVRAVDPVGVWHLEPGENYAAADFAPSLDGEVVPGRFGRGLAVPFEGKGTLFSLAMPSDDVRFDLRHGFALRFDLYLHTGLAGRLVQIGQGLQVDMDEAGLVRARMTPKGNANAGAGGGTGAAVTMVADRPLPTKRWVGVEIIHDGRDAWISFDGVPQCETVAVNSLNQQPSDVLMFAPSDAPFDGILDEVELAAYVIGSPARIPETMEITGPARVAFSATGEPMERVEFKIRDLADPGEDAEPFETYAVTGGGVLRRVDSKPTQGKQP